MKIIFSFIFATIAFSTAHAECGNYFTSSEKAEARAVELLDEDFASGKERFIDVIELSKETKTPCWTGKDQFYIEIDGEIQSTEGDYNNFAG